jgi:glutaminyl-peptide cyclotransferase
MRYRLLLMALLLLASAGLALAQDPAAPVEQLQVEVISVRPHSTTAYTQGLLLHDGVFYESDGQYGASSLRRVDPQTGEVLQQVDINQQFFAEGLALVGDDTLIQITWREGFAFIYDRETFQQLGLFFYEGEGWGLCYDGQYLWMSNGSEILYKRDPQFFRVLEEVVVTLEDQALPNLNELECVGDYIYANVYQTEMIYRIDKTTGVVTAAVDASGLLTEAERANLGADPDSAAVLNGIAYDPANEVFYITGKLWPSLFEVRFVPTE